MSRFCLAATISAALLPAAPAVHAQVGWRQVTGVPQPLPRVGHGLAFDAARGRAVLFGGSFSSPGTDTWEWDGTSWTQRVPATSPPNGFHPMVYDSRRGRVVLFTGSDVWEWDGTVWSMRPAVTRPSGRFLSAMAYDAARGRTVLFGGDTGGVQSLSDTWEWDGTSWFQPLPATSPGPRDSHAMAFDSRRGRVVLYGGRHQSWPNTWWVQDTDELDAAPARREPTGPLRPRARVRLGAGSDRPLLGFAADRGHVAVGRDHVVAAVHAGGPEATRVARDGL